MHVLSSSVFCFNKWRIKKSPSAISGGGFRINELAMTYSHMDNSTLPSALRGFTSEFGKGSGGSLLLLSPAQLFMTIRWVLFTHCVCLTFIKWVINRYIWVDFNIKHSFMSFARTNIINVCLFLAHVSSFITKSSCLQWFEPQHQLFGCCIVKPHEQLVLVSFTYHYASTSNLSTS